MTIIDRAEKFAHAAHDSIKQVRKYTGEPYWVHTDAVASLVRMAGGSPDMIAAAHMHDVLEDVASGVLYGPFGMISMEREFGHRIAMMVFHLTDIFTRENYPNLNRAHRKELEANRYAYVINNIKTIKLADLIDNTKSIEEHDPKFAKIYMAEKAELLKSLLGGDPALYHRARLNLA